MSNVQLEKIFGLSDNDIEKIKSIYMKSYGHKTENQIKQEQLEEQNDMLLTQLQSIMPKDRLLKVLPLFVKRDDAEILKQTTLDATVPTIFEWVVAIGWYYLSKNKYNLKKSMQLSLDTDGYPITQAAGQKNKDAVSSGDIVVDYEEKVVQLEATLMDRNAIKHGEWEPVLRHTANLTADRYPVPVQTYFITSQIDKNTENIWRSVAATDIEETGNKHRSVRVVIYPINILTFVHWIETDSINEKNIWQAFNDSYKPLLEAPFDDNWKQKILDKISQ